MGLLDFKFADTQQAKDLLSLSGKASPMQNSQAQSPMRQAFSMPSSLGAAAATGLTSVPQYAPKQMSWEQLTGSSTPIQPYTNWAKITGMSDTSAVVPQYNTYKTGGGTLPGYDWWNVYKPGGAIVGSNQYSLPPNNPWEGSN